MDGLQERVVFLFETQGIGSGPNLFLSHYSFFYFGLSLVSGTAFVYFLKRRASLTPTFRSLVFPFLAIFLWSVAWAVCNSFLAPWTAYFFIYLKNPAVLLLGLTLSRLGFQFPQNSFPRWEKVSLWIGGIFCLIAFVFNGLGVLFREITFDTKLEFFVPIQKSDVPWVNASILSIAFVLSLLLINTLFCLLAKIFILKGKERNQVIGFFVAFLSILGLAVLDIFADLDVFSKPVYLFFLTNFTVIFTTILVLVALNQETVPSSVGFKIMAFNITIHYLVLSIVANFLFNRFRIDSINEMDREKQTIRLQLESGIYHPFVYFSDLVIDMENFNFRINKTQKQKSDFFELYNRKENFESYRLEALHPTVHGIFWTSDLLANNRHFIVAYPYLDYRENIHKSVVWLIITLIFSLLIVFLLYPLIHKASIVAPLQKLLEAIGKMKAGEIDVRVEIPGKDEIGEISKSFNEMISVIANVNLGLESMVAERTQSLNQKINELKEAQEQLLISERMSTLGKIAASVAHEINNPLAAIKGSIQFIKDRQIESKELLENEAKFESLGKQLFQNLRFGKRMNFTNRTKRKKEFRKFLTENQFEDIDNLLDTCFDLGLETISEEFQELFHSEQGRSVFLNQLAAYQIQFHLDIMETAVDRASKIVFALKHHSYAGPKDKMTLFSLKDGIESVLTMYAAHWKQGIELSFNLEKEVFILGHANELVQVWTNLLYNAIQACPKDQGKIHVSLNSDANAAIVLIRDNGSGVAPEIQARIFEPFFTTKELGMGTGLGLSIVKNIIETHGGSIRLESHPGKTQFEIRLPLANS